MDFPELSGVKEEHDPRPEEILITNAVDKFLQLMRGKNRGNVLSERDHRFLKTFTEDEQYRLLLPSLEEQLREEKEAANA
jgi:hypothetical protein